MTFNILRVDPRPRILLWHSAWYNLYTVCHFLAPARCISIIIYLLHKTDYSTIYFTHTRLLFSLLKTDRVKFDVSPFRQRNNRPLRMKSSARNAEGLSACSLPRPSAVLQRESHLIMARAYGLSGGNVRIFPCGPAASSDHRFHKTYKGGWCNCYCRRNCKKPRGTRRSETFQASRARNDDAKRCAGERCM